MFINIQNLKLQKTDYPVLELFKKILSGSCFERRVQLSGCAIVWVLSIHLGSTFTPPFRMTSVHERHYHWRASWLGFCGRLFSVLTQV